jgi:hypothetical protein
MARRRDVVGDAHARHGRFNASGTWPPRSHPDGPPQGESVALDDPVARARRAFLKLAREGRNAIANLAVSQDAEDRQHHSTNSRGSMTPINGNNARRSEHECLEEPCRMRAMPFWWDCSQSSIAQPDLRPTTLLRGAPFRPLSGA